MTSKASDGLELIVQAAERLRDLRLPIPWELCPPVPPALAAAMSGALRVEADAGLFLAVLLGWAAGSAALFALVWLHPGDSPAWQAAAVSALLPSRFLALFVAGEPQTVLFWSIVPVVGLAGTWLYEQPGWRSGIVAVLALAGLIGCRSLRVTPIDLLAAAELAALAALIWTNKRRHRQRAALAGLGALVGLFATTSAASPPRHQGRTIESLALDLQLDARRRAAAALIASDSYPEETLLWLRALAVESVTAPIDGKLANLLDCLEIVGDNCRFGLTQNTADAVIVSHSGLAELRPVRGPLDVERLERYVAWAGRPESLHVRRPIPGRLQIRADVGPNAAILLRRHFSADWRVYPASIKLRPDPLGYLVLDPAEAPDGPLEITLDSAALLPSLLWPPPLDKQPIDFAEMPSLHPEGVVNGSTLSGPPFKPRAVLSLFGNRFSPNGNSVAIGGLPAELLFESPTQLNIRLPDLLPAGIHDLTVTSNNRTTEPYPVEVAP
jgi:hypothetical protein